MEQDEIIEIARQAGLEDTDFPFDEWEPVELIAFAKLVAERTAAKEREACAKVCESLFDLEDDSCDEAEKCAEAIRARAQADRGEQHEQQ